MRDRFDCCRDRFAVWLANHVLRIATRRYRANLQSVVMVGLVARMAEEITKEIQR